MTSDGLAHLVESFDSRGIVETRFWRWWGGRTLQWRQWMPTWPRTISRFRPRVLAAMSSPDASKASICFRTRHWYSERFLSSDGNHSCLIIWGFRQAAMALGPGSFVTEKGVQLILWNLFLLVSSRRKLRDSKYVRSSKYQCTGVLYYLSLIRCTEPGTRYRRGFSMPEKTMYYQVV